VEVVVDPLDPGRVRFAAAGLRAVDLEGPRPPRPPIPATAPVPTARLEAHEGNGSAAPRSGTSAPEPIHALIEVETTGSSPWAFVFRGGVVRIGRGLDNELVLADDRVSRRHGQLTARQGTLVYADLGSSNGSLVNGSPVREIALGVGDVVRVGNSTLTIRPG
jgi:pSer/pThr/pTyr-binding forkhead associated (FHA) protein